MVTGIFKKVEDFANDPEGGVINRTVARLIGSGVQTDSRLVKTRVLWNSKGSETDWRVKLTVPIGSPVDNYLFGGGQGPAGQYRDNNVLAPLAQSKGMFWPLTPSMVIQHSANYNALAQTHSNYPFQAYQNSQVDSLNIIGEFPVQNQQDAKHWVASVKFLRTVTKMFFGEERELKGNPPPILHLSGYGKHMFDKVPVVVNSFNVELRSGIDYISTSGVVGRRSDASTNYNGEDSTWAPTLSNISVLVTPVYSRDTVKRFSLKEFARGTLGTREGIGFI